MAESCSPASTPGNDLASPILPARRPAPRAAAAAAADADGMMASLWLFWQPGDDTAYVCEMWLNGCVYIGELQRTEAPCYKPSWQLYTVFAWACVGVHVCCMLEINFKIYNQILILFYFVKVISVTLFLHSQRTESVLSHLCQPAVCDKHKSWHL